MCPVSAALLPSVTPFPQVNVLPDPGMTGRHLKCCTVPHSALIQFRVSPDPADGICAQNMSPTELRGQQWVSNVGPLRMATVQQCRSQRRAAAVGSDLPNATPSTTNCNGPTAVQLSTVCLSGRLYCALRAARRGAVLRIAYICF